MVKYIPPDKPDPWWRVELPAVLIGMMIFFVFMCFSA